jgi:hypothetical protein
MTRATRQASITSQTITVEHIRISSELSFAEVRRKIEGTVPKLDTGIAEALRSDDQKRAKDYEENGPKLSIFGERDHGAVLRIVGGRRSALQYDIGNPLTASKMTRYQLPAALYAPLRVVLFENEQGRGVAHCVRIVPPHKGRGKAGVRRDDKDPFTLLEPVSPPAACGGSEALAAQSRALSVRRWPCRPPDRTVPCPRDRRAC